MPNEIVKFGGPRGGSISRNVGRSLERIQGGADVGVARVEARGEIQTAKIDVASAITQRGMQGAAFITQVQLQLADAVPAAAERIHGIAVTGVMGLSEIVVDSVHHLRRI